MGDPVMIPQRMPYVLEMEPGKYYWCRCGRSKTQPIFAMGPTRARSIRRWKSNSPRTNA